MTPRGIQNALQCNPRFSGAFQLVCLQLLRVPRYCFAHTACACADALRKQRTSTGSGEGREKLKERKCRDFLCTGAD